MGECASNPHTEKEFEEKEWNIVEWTQNEPLKGARGFFLYVEACWP